VQSASPGIAERATDTARRPIPGLLGTGVSYTPTEHVEIRLAGERRNPDQRQFRSRLITKGQTIGGDVSYDFGNDFVGAISTSLKVRF
jgi:long-chain fatty acid transport protein